MLKQNTGRATNVFSCLSGRVFSFVLGLSTLFSLAACSYQGAYDAAQDNHKQSCHGLQQAAYEECIGDDNLDYREYQREREKLLDADENQ